MSFLKDIGKAVTDAASYVTEKNRKAAHINRIRTVIQCEEKAANKQYLALGRYYYNNLRDKSNPVTEPHCAEIEAIEARLDRALNELENSYNEQLKPVVAEVITEEITLEDVECYDTDPMAEPAPAPGADEPVSQEGDVPPEELPVNTEAAEPTENDDLPFEG